MYIYIYPPRICFTSSEAISRCLKPATNTLSGTLSCDPTDVEERPGKGSASPGVIKGGQIGHLLCLLYT